MGVKLGDPQRRLEESCFWDTNHQISSPNQRDPGHCPSPTWWKTGGLFLGESKTVSGAQDTRQVQNWGAPYWKHGIQVNMNLRIETPAGMYHLTSRRVPGYCLPGWPVEESGDSESLLFREKRCKEKRWDSPSGPVAKDIPASAEDMVSIPGPGRSHVGGSS